MDGIHSFQYTPKIASLDRSVEHEGNEIRVLRIQEGKIGKTVDIILAGDLETSET